MKRKYLYIKIFLAILLPFSISVFYLSSSSPELIDEIYSASIFRVIGQVLATITGIVPISLAEIVLVLFALGSVVFLIYSFVRIIKAPKKLIQTGIFIIDILGAAGIIYFIFVFSWGLNYNRLPLSKVLSLDVHPTSVNELSILCSDLVAKTNESRKFVDEDTGGHMKLNRNTVFDQAVRGYDSLNEFPILTGSFGRPKPVFMSRLMSYLGIQGFYFPYTAEANIDSDIPDCSLPNTMCHEMAHQRGIAREDEANFISYIACLNNPEPAFKYSGYQLALIYSMNALYDNDRSDFNKIAGNYSPALRRDLIQINEYWKQFEGPVQKTSENINNAYLKSNLQKDGVKSYGRMVDLLIGYSRKNGVLKGR